MTVTTPGPAGRHVGCAAPPELRRLQGDEGLTLVLVALLLVVIMLGAAIALDGGSGYQQHRQMQNASDAAALAGIRMLDQNKFGTPLANARDEIRDEIIAKARLNGADSTGIECYLLDSNKNKIMTLGGLNGEFCTNSADVAAFNQTSALEGGAYGVWVRAPQTKRTNFANVAGASSLTGRAQAGVVIKPFIGTTASPFMVCGFDPSSPNGNVTNPTGYAYNILSYDGSKTPPYSVRADATGKYYYLQGAQVPSCGAGSSSFDGHNDASTYLPPLPAWVNPGTGSGYEDFISVAVAGMKPCVPAGPDGIPGTQDDNTFEGCALLMPIAIEWNGQTGSNAKFHNVMWTVWEVWGSGSSYNFTNPLIGEPGSGVGNRGKNCENAIRITANTGNMKYCGKLLGQSQMILTGGLAGDGIPLPGTTRVFKFSE